MATNGTDSAAPDLGKAQLSSLAWIEPVIILSIMTTSLILNRRKSYSIIPRSRDSSPLRGSRRSSEDTLVDATEDESMTESDDSLLRPHKRRPSWHTKQMETTSNANHIHSRILQKFPFLVEMFYWILNYAAYRFSKGTASVLWGFKGNAVTQLAQDHGISILAFEHESMFSFLFPIKEVVVQHYFLGNHLSTMTVLNQIYSLVHIPGTVAFISWYYYAAPNHRTFAVARRTMTLGNFVAFLVFAVYPCMPPRLLPKSFGFEDTVRQAHAESVWVGDGKNVNQLAAMPSLHFTYALVIGCTFFWHSGFLQSLRGKRRDRSFFGMILFMIASLIYPMLVLLVIVATGNHYYLDAIAATFSVILCFLGNRIWLYLLPLEGLLLKILRLQKPVPTTGERRRKGSVEEDGDDLDSFV